MGLIITEPAARFLLARLTPAQLPLRLSKNVKGGCGDIAHRFEPGAKVQPDDTVVEAFGLTIVCDLFENSEFADALIDLHRSAGVGATEKVVVIPDGATLCGCGSSAAMPKG